SRPTPRCSTRSPPTPRRSCSPARSRSRPPPSRPPRAGPSRSPPRRPTPADARREPRWGRRPVVVGASARPAGGGGADLHGLTTRHVVHPARRHGPPGRVASGRIGSAAMAYETVTGYCWPQSAEGGDVVGLHLSAARGRPVSVEV